MIEARHHLTEVERTVLPPRTDYVDAEQATGLVPERGITVAGQLRNLTGLRYLYVTAPSRCGTPSIHKMSRGSLGANGGSVRPHRATERRRGVTPRDARRPPVMVHHAR